MTFKQNTKMNASGSHYCAGGRVKKMNNGGSTGGTDPDPRDTANEQWKIQKAGLKVQSDWQKKHPIIDKFYGNPSADSAITAGDALANIREQQMEADRATRKKRGGAVRKGKK